jgi:1-deoxy-D-xylulose-5-phosphate reductoisomerase
MQKKKVIILGSTGSIGVSALDVCAGRPDAFAVKALSCNANLRLLADQAAAFGPESVSIGEGASPASGAFGVSRVYAGEAGLLEMIRNTEADLVINGISGARGLLPSIAAIESGKTLALANKETIVMAGSLVMETAKNHGVRIIPVDSEHSGLFQIIRGIGPERVSEITITASGGAVRDVPVDRLASLGPGEVLRHPTWNMGKKITVDSATGANKGLEIIEAHHLFAMPGSRIKVMQHPESLVHAIVRTSDGYLYMQASVPDMRMAIHHALFYPDHEAFACEPLELAGRELRFFPVDEKKYRMVGLGYMALEHGGAHAIVYNASNEIAVESFLEGAIRFTDIPAIVEETLAAQWENLVASIEGILDTDTRARERARAVLDRIRKGKTKWM